MLAKGLPVRTTQSLLGLGETGAPFAADAISAAGALIGLTPPRSHG